MMRNPINPFEYGGVVAENAFCNRAREKADLAKAIRNHEKLFAFSERRLGKMSLMPRGCLSGLGGSRPATELAGARLSETLRLAREHPGKCIARSAAR